MILCHQILLCFNSKLVRLKACSIGPGYTLETGFNSKLVRLKAGYLQRAINRLLCFNSKLVRLKGVNPRTIGANNRKFQFQTGSIKSNLKSGLKRFQSRFNSKLVRLKVY